jgi:phage minor structural protein
MTELVWVYDVAEVQVAALADPAGLEVDERLQDSETLRFTVRADDPKANYLDEDRILLYASRRYRITELEMERAGSAVLWHVGAEALWIDLLGFPSPAAAIVSATISQGLDLILAGTNWAAGAVELDGGNYSLDTSVDSTALALLRAWAHMTDRDLIFDSLTREVSLVAAQGTDRGMGFRYGRNLVTVKRKSEPPSVTRLYPVGAEDLSISGVSPDGLPYIDNFTYYTDQGLTLPQAQARYLKVQRWEDNRYLLALNLYDAGVLRLAKLAVPRVSYEMSVVDLAALTGTGELLEVGDTVRVDDAPTGITLATRIVRKVTRPLEPAKATVELGFLAPGISGSPSHSSVSGGSGGGAMSMLVDLNNAPLNVVGGLVTLAAIALGVEPPDIANTIFGLELDATATGTGTLTISFWYGATQVGPTSLVPFTAGPVHVSVPDFLVGLTASNSFNAKAQVTAGTGTVLVPANAAHLYVIGTGLSGGGVGSGSTVEIAEPVTYYAHVADAAPTAGLLTPVDASPPGESVDTTPDAVTETVTAVTTP